MVVCNVCQGERFDLQDGHYYCVDCHTQALDWREEEGEAFTQHTKISYLATSFKETDEQLAEKSIISIQEQWTSWEGFNNILVGQVSEIESLTNMPPDFRFTVFNLWTKYLQVNQICFTNKRAVPHLTKALSKRDFAWINGKQFKNSLKKKPFRKKDALNTEESSEASSKISLSSLKRKLASQQYQSESSLNDSSSMHDTTEAEESSEQEDDPSIVKWNKLCDRKKSRPKSLTRKTLIGIIYLALRLSESQIQLADLYRWMNCNHISYRRVEHFLPGEPLLLGGDKKLFGPKSSLFGCQVSNKRVIVTEAIEIFQTLEYPFVPNIDLMPLVRRYLQELILPESLAVHIEKIIKSARPNLEFNPDEKRGKYIPLPEERAMAFILFTLKMLLGLNDLTEFQCSNLAEAQENPEGHFVWTKWVELIELRNSILVDNFYWAKQIYDKNAVQNRNNVIQLDSNFVATSAELYTPGTSTISKTAVSFLSSLAARLTRSSTSAEEPSGPRVEPTKSLTFLTSALTVALSEGNFQSLTEEVERSLNTFRSSSCDFLIDNEKSSVSVSCELKTDKKRLKTMTFVPEVRGKRLIFQTTKVELWKSRPQVKAPPKNSSNQRLKLPGQMPNKSYWVFPLHHKISEVYGKDVLHQNLPVSFLWLLKQCAAVVDSSPLEIYKELLVVEAAFLLDDNEDLGPTESLLQMKFFKQRY